MFNLAILGLVAPLMLAIGAAPLAYRLYLKIRGQWKSLKSTTVSAAQLIIGVLCIMAAFFAPPFYDMLTAGLLLLVGLTGTVTVVLAGGRIRWAAMTAIIIGVNFGYLGSASFKYKVSTFFDLLDKNVPETTVGIVLAVLVAMAAYLILAILQELLQTFATVLDWGPIVLVILVICSAQGLLLLAGSSLQPFLVDLINQG